MPSFELNGWKIILASSSPRRKELLGSLGFDFEVRVREVDESVPEGMKREEVALYLAHRKAIQFKDDISAGEIIITADTIVVLDGEILGKPLNPGEARDTLRRLSGRSHEVITAVCMLTSGSVDKFYSETKVSFTHLEDEEITYYIENFAPYDKAGAYGIQEWIGMIGVDHIEGSYFNVMGLPVRLIYSRLKAMGVVGLME